MQQNVSFVKKIFKFISHKIIINLNEIHEDVNSAKINSAKQMNAVFFDIKDVMLLMKKIKFL